MCFYWLIFFLFLKKHKIEKKMNKATIMKVFVDILAMTLCRYFPESLYMYVDVFKNV